MDYGPEYSEYKDSVIGVYGGKFYPPHKGHVDLALKAVEQCDVLFIIVQHDEEYENLLIEGTNFRYIPPNLRERWLTEIFKDYPNIRVLSHPEKRVPDHLTNAEVKKEYEELEKLLGKINKVFSADDYTDYFNYVLPGTQQVIIPRENNISATKIRENLYKNFKNLPTPVQKHYQKRVAFIGGESAGKSFTTKQLSKKLGYPFTPEYGREFYDDLGGYGSIQLPEDFINISAHHLQQLKKAAAAPILLVDTDLIYTQFFFLESNGYLHPVLDALIKENADKIDHYIFLEPFEFEDDGTRSRKTEKQRTETFERLKKLYHYYEKNFDVVNGDGDKRLETIENLIKGGDDEISR